MFSLVDGLIQGEGIHEGRLTGFMSTVESRVRIPWRGGAVRSLVNYFIIVKEMLFKMTFKFRPY